MISPEVEFYVFNHNESKFTEIKENQGYFIAPPLDNAKEYRKKLSDALMECGYPVKYHHHESGKSQHEIEIDDLDAIHAADFCCFFKYIARDIASPENFPIFVHPCAERKPADASPGFHHGSIPSTDRIHHP